jgi:hypothetical protein
LPPTEKYGLKNYRLAITYFNRFRTVFGRMPSEPRLSVAKLSEPHDMLNFVTIYARCP